MMRSLERSILRTYTHMTRGEEQPDAAQILMMIMILMIICCLPTGSSSRRTRDRASPLLPVIPSGHEPEAAFECQWLTGHLLCETPRPRTRMEMMTPRRPCPVWSKFKPRDSHRQLVVCVQQLPLRQRQPPDELQKLPLRLDALQVIPPLLRNLPDGGWGVVGAALAFKG